MIASEGVALKRAKEEARVCAADGASGWGDGAELPMRVEPKHSLPGWEMGLTPKTSSARAKCFRRSGVNGRVARRETPMGELSSLKRVCQAKWISFKPRAGLFEPERGGGTT
jgi:hypothetical protein